MQQYEVLVTTTIKLHNTFIVEASDQFEAEDKVYDVAHKAKPFGSDIFVDRAKPVERTKGVQQ